MLRMFLMKNKVLNLTIPSKYICIAVFTILGFFVSFILESRQQWFFELLSLKKIIPIKTGMPFNLNEFITNKSNPFATLEPLIDTNADVAWQKTILYDILDKYHAKTLNTCRNQCDADDKLCAVKSVDEWNYLIEKSELPYVPLVDHFQYIYPFEREYMSSPPLHDTKKLPDLKKSRVFVSGSKNGLMRCRINDVIKGRVDLIDGYWKHRIKGGDEIRVWMTDKKTGEYKVAGPTFDMNNGSYTFSLKCLWPGEAHLYVVVSHPREFRRIAISQTHLGCTRYITGQFKNDAASEDTICFTTPNIPGRPCLCNFTNINQQQFYCGRPLDPRLTCNDWIGTTSLVIPKPINLTSAERNLTEDIPGPASKRSIDHNIQVIVSSSGQLPSLSSCAKTSLNVTWTKSEAPQGYWSKGLKWNYLLCERPKWTMSWILTCLRDTNIWFIGDSNALQLFTVLSKVTESTFFTPGNIPWPWRGSRQNREYNITMTFSPHENPLYFGTNTIASLPYGGVAQQIDEIPSAGQYVVVLHYYLHLTPSHLSIAHLQLITVRDAMVRLLQRNSEVLIAFRGPHISSFDWDFNHAVGGDTLGWFYKDIIFKVFQNFKNRILFLDGWEMTIALGNPFFHAHENVAYEMLHTLFSFKCA